MELIKEIEILDPPTKYVKTAKRKIDPKTGKLKTHTYYLGENLFFGSNALHFTVMYEIVNFCKDFLLLHLTDIPKLLKCRIHIEYHRKEQTWDLDNKGFFWIKLVQDLLKTPTNNQLLKAINKGTKIKTLRIVRDDNVKFIDKLTVEYFKGQHKMVVKIYGIKDEEQATLF